MKSSRQIILAGLMLIHACCAAVATPLVSRRADIARIFGFPEECLVEKDITGEVQRRQGTGVIAAWIYKSTNHTFAPIVIGVAQAGTFVNAEMREEVSAYWKKLGSTGAISPIAIGDSADGYVFSTCGPGGSSTLIALQMPAKRVDVQITLTVPGDPPLDSLPETERYHQLITTGGQTLDDRLTEFASHVAQSYNVMATLSNAAESVTTPRQDTREAQTQRSTVVEDVSSNKYASTDPVNQPAASAERSERNWRVVTPVVVAGIIAVVLLAYACFWRRGGRQRPH